jgi:SAM-dependent methyltransferase
MNQHSKHDHDRHGARQAERFNPERASRLDDPRRFEYLPPEQVVRMLDAPTNGSVLDFGTGTGTYAIELARLRSDVEVIALDEQPAMLDLLRKKPEVASLPNLQPMLVTQSAGLIGQIDCVLALNVLHELGDEALRSLRAPLKPGGSALFIDWNAEVDRPAGPPRDHVYSPAEARARLEKLGFQIEMERLFPYQYAFRARFPK